MTHQQASEGSNIISNQLWLSPEGTSLEDRNPLAGSCYRS
ncbi:hypothetical protein HNP72_002690 [Sphingobacterium soli]|nr:hypothetical protein [Sphingobacterium soli]